MSPVLRWLLTPCIPPAAVIVLFGTLLYEYVVIWRYARMIWNKYEYVRRYYGINHTV